MAGDSRAKARARLLPNLLLILVSLVAGLLLAEFATRIMLADVGTTGGSGSYLSRQWYAQNPPQRNSLGYRERAFTPAPAPGVVRIAAVGDSFSFGPGLVEADRVSNRLETLLNADGGSRYEVLNFGRPGAGYEEHVVNMRTAIQSAKPHFILLQWYLNDLDDPLDKRPRPRPPSPVIHEELNAASALYGLLAGVFADLQVKLGLVPVDAYYARFLDPRDPIARRAEARFARILDVARQADVPIAIYIWPELTRPLGTSPNDPIIDQLMERCSTARVRCMDLRPVLARVPEHEALIVNRFDTHASAHANRLAAAAVKQALATDLADLARQVAAAPAD